MATNFDNAFALLMKIEVGGAPNGGYVNDPRDPGGETKYGISKRVAIACGYTGEMKDMTEDEAKVIAKSAYWDRYQCDEFDFRVAYQIFDVAYNGGAIIKWLQKIVNVTVDGVLGPNTIKEIKAEDTLSLIIKINSARLSYYTSLKKLWPSFGAGWTNRVASNLLLAVS